MYTYDMASNCSEWSTGKMCMYNAVLCVDRGVQSYTLVKAITIQMLVGTSPLLSLSIRQKSSPTHSFI